LHCPGGLSVCDLTVKKGRPGVFKTQVLVSILTIEWFVYHTRRYTSARIYLLPFTIHRLGIGFRCHSLGTPESVLVPLQREVLVLKVLSNSANNRVQISVKAKNTATSKLKQRLYLQYVENITLAFSRTAS